MRVYVDVERPAPRPLRPVIEALGNDQVVIYPTDTGYAFGCALSRPKAIAKLRRLKNVGDRDFKPLSMIVSDFSEIGRYGHMDNRVFRVVRRILPGPYTIVLPATSDVPRAMRNRNHEIGVRVPQHALCQKLVELLGEPLLTGSVTQADDEPELEDPEVLERRYARDVDIVIDTGLWWPEPSTVLRLADGQIEVLREGQGAIPG